MPIKFHKAIPFKLFYNTFQSFKSPLLSKDIKNLPNILYPANRLYYFSILFSQFNN